MELTAAKLKQWREGMKMSQQELADALGVSNITVSRWERQAREIPPFLHLALEALKRRKTTKK